MTRSPIIQTKAPKNIDLPLGVCLCCLHIEIAILSQLFTDKN